MNSLLLPGKKMKNKIRISFQLIFLSLILYVAARPFFDKAYLADFEKFCPFGGISSFFSKLNIDTMACNMNETQVLLGLGLILGIGLIGKLFCSFVCPVGTVSEWIGRLGDKLKIRRELPVKLDRYFRALKYILLFVTVYFTMTSSELFCKTFDPYYASVNLFNNTDIVLYYAIPAFLILVGGALFFRLFWCKYLCPLGAISNVFMNIPVAGGVIVIFLAANYFGAGLSFVWLLGGLALAGLINEVGFMRSFFLPAPKIRRSDSCSNCGLCNAKCPQGIKISEMEVVNHIDCNLCTDCVHNCPKVNTLTISKKRSLKHLAPVMVVVLITLSMVLASFFEFTTISKRWGKPSGTGAVYTQAGIKSIKCFGSSSALAGTLEGIEGIYGLDTYTKTHTVKVYYDPSVISEKKVKESLFNPVKTEITEEINSSVDSVGVLDLGIYGLFDQIDFNNLYYLLSEKEGIFGFESHFGEPVRTIIYYNPSKFTPADIKKQIEKEVVVVKKETGDEKIELSFKAENDGIIKGKITPFEYKKRIFNSFEERFNDYESYKEEQLTVFIFPMPEAVDAELSGSLVYLASHLSGYDGIVRFRTGWFHEPSGFVYFNASKTDLETVRDALIKSKFKIYVSETETEEMDNPFHIKPNGTLINAKDIGE